ncbi:outer membrane beta-barrel protein [Gelidibacter gilvus]|uniref:Porin family protein n=1 Tax=Gelidibacter gilvus TaxID=59602 RepID=A0A4Q0XJD6_9FLAO|nr:outer membrane beta-barrel protein [Gelidibacter gilvus]RXJ51381.1 porin family protein [Gelidibacter gilvus]
MKKVMFMAAFAVFGLSNVNAQEVETTYGFEEGSIMLEGGLGFNTTNNKNSDTKTSGFTISPKVGYFLTEDFAVGVEGLYASSTREVAGIDTGDNKSFGAGVFARYYFLDLGKRFKTYTELGLGYVSNKDKIADVKADGFGAGLNLGINYFVTENIAISFGLADVLSYSSAKVDGGKAVSGFNGNINVFNNFFDTAQFGLLFKL